MKETIAYIGKDDFPVRVKFEYQPFVPEEIIDDIKNEQIEPAVDIKSISFGDFALDETMNEVAVKDIRKQCLTYMSRVASKFTDFPEINGEEK
jgi:hypothetical protein